MEMDGPSGPCRPGRHLSAPRPCPGLRRREAWARPCLHGGADGPVFRSGGGPCRSPVRRGGPASRFGPLPAFRREDGLFRRPSAPRPGGGPRTFRPAGPPASSSPPGDGSGLPPGGAGKDGGPAPWGTVPASAGPVWARFSAPRPGGASGPSGRRPRRTAPDPAGPAAPLRRRPAPNPSEPR